MTLNILKYEVINELRKWLGLTYTLMDTLVMFRYSYERFKGISCIFWRLKEKDAHHDDPFRRGCNLIHFKFICKVGQPWLHKLSMNQLVRIIKLKADGQLRFCIYTFPIISKYILSDYSLQLNTRSYSSWVSARTS